MPKAKIEGLLTELHDKYATSDTSPEQDAMMLQLQSHLASWDGPSPPDGSVVTTAEMLLESFKEKHPQLSAVLKEIMDNLGRIGV